MRVRAEERGIGELLAMLFLGVIGLTWAAIELDRRGVEVERDQAYASGALFAKWMQAAHVRAQEEWESYSATLSGGSLGVAMTPAEIRGDGLVPAWVMDETALGQTIRLGVVDDGVGVPMAFAVASPDPDRRVSSLAAEAFRSGAAGGGVFGIEEFSSSDDQWFELGAETFSVNVPGSTAPGREAAIEDVLGRALATGDLVAVADLAIVFDENVVHRRPQPGREYLSEMRTDLRFASDQGIPFERDALDDPVPDTGVGLVVSEEWETSGLFLVGKDAAVARDALVSCEPLPCEAAGGGRIG